MRSFQFRLDRVLDWYQNQFQIEQARLGVAMTAQDRAQQNLARFHAECLGVERDIIGRHEIPARDFAALGLFRLRARKTEIELTQCVQRAETAVRDQLQRLQDAQRRVRLLEKLRDRRKAEHRYLEEKELEDLAAEAFLAKWDRPSGLTGTSRKPSPIFPMAPSSHDGSRP
jgi:flagellar export protein FliJ